MSEQTLMPESIQVEIGELVLHGFAPGDRHAIATAVEQELTRLIAAGIAPAAWNQGGAVDRVDAGAFTLHAGARGAAVGAQVAGQLYRALGGTTHE